MAIKSIDTLYRGCYFRSRLEARWALAFDMLKIKWRYEPEAYRVGPEGLPYLPDFLLPDFGTWVEVKGTEEDFIAKADVYAAAVHPESGLPGMADSTFTTRGLLVLGPIPEVAPDSRRPVHSMIQHGAQWGAEDGGEIGMWRAWASFAADARIVLVGAGGHPVAPVGELPAMDSSFTRTLRLPGPFGPNQVAGAYAIARAARFDQGSKGLAESIAAAMDRFTNELEDSARVPDTNEMWGRSEDSVLEFPHEKPTRRKLAARRQTGSRFDEWDRRITADGQLVSQTPEHIAGMAKAKAELAALSERRAA